eukprot:4641080-Amphidinium_carterae.1
MGHHGQHHDYARVLDPSSGRVALQNRYTGASIWAPIELQHGKDAADLALEDAGLVRIAAHHEEHDLVFTELDTVVGVAGFSCGICSSIKKGGRCSLSNLYKHPSEEGFPGLLRVILPQVALQNLQDELLLA